MKNLRNIFLFLILFFMTKSTFAFTSDEFYLSCYKAQNNGSLTVDIQFVVNSSWSTVATLSPWQTIYFDPLPNWYNPRVAMTSSPFETINYNMDCREEYRPRKTADDLPPTTNTWTTETFTFSSLSSIFDDLSLSWSTYTDKAEIFDTAWDYELNYYEPLQDIVKNLIEIKILILIIWFFALIFYFTWIVNNMIWK